MLDYTVEQFISDVRTRIGDTSQSVPNSSILAYLRTALRRVARADGTQKLFERRDTFDLSNINKDGTPSASWSLSKIGTLLDIPNLRILKADTSQIKELFPSYKEPTEFYSQCPMPEQNQPGDPQTFTIDRIGPSTTKLVFNRPIKDLVTIDIWYSVFPPMITDPSELFPVPYDFADIFEEYVIILHYSETADDNRARSAWEDLDVLTAELVEMLARRERGLPYRRIRRSF